MSPAPLLGPRRSWLEDGMSSLAHTSARTTWGSIPPTATMSNIDFLKVPWFVVEDTLLGGWAISNVNKPTHELDPRKGEVESGSFLTEEMARHIVKFHNEWLASRS